MRISSLGLILGLLTAGAAGATTWTVDPSHTQALFKVDHLGLSHIHGLFSVDNGELTISPEGVLTAVKVSLDAKSAVTGNGKRDSHLRSPDFFDAVQFPSLSFESSSVKKVGAKSYQVTGRLSLHGVAKVATLTVVHRGTIKDPWGKTRAGFEATFSVNRMDYGITYGDGVIGKQVEVNISLQATQED